MSDCLTCAEPDELHNGRRKCLKPFPDAIGSVCVDCTGKLVAAFAQQFRRTNTTPPPAPKPTGPPTATGEAPVLQQEAKAA